PRSLNVKDPPALHRPPPPGALRLRLALPSRRSPGRPEARLRRQRLAPRGPAPRLEHGGRPRERADALSPLSEEPLEIPQGGPGRLEEPVPGRQPLGEHPSP